MAHVANVVEPPADRELWKVCRVDVNAEPVTDEQRTELFAWLAALGIDHPRCYPTLVVSQRPDKVLLLHVSVFAHNSAGGPVIDYAVNRVHTNPLAVQITDFPAWLVQASHIQDQTKKGDRPCLS